jgi:hypothetical protein
MRINHLAYLTLIVLSSMNIFGQDKLTGFDSESWPEADLLFHSDHQWKGADGAYSVDLGNDRVLWLFADTYIAYKSPYKRTREFVSMIRNSVGIQKGYDPGNAAMRFFWRNDDIIPKSFFPESDTTWLWPLDGIRLADKLIIFFSILHEIESGLGFQVCGFTAKLIENPDENPDKWLIKDIPLPYAQDSILIGSALEIYDGYLYSFCCREPVNHDIFLCRWPLDSAGVGHLLNPEWWCKEKKSWVRQLDMKSTSEIIINGGTTEFSVWFDSSLNKFLQVQTIGFGQAKLVVRQAEWITGPWSEPGVVYEPPENDIPEIMIYAGKAHPHLDGADIVLTYATNGPESLIVADTCLYYPRFVRLNYGQ